MYTENREPDKRGLTKQISAKIIHVTCKLCNNFISQAIQISDLQKAKTITALLKKKDKLGLE